MKDERFMEFISKRLEESAAGVYTEAVIPTPCSQTEQFAMLIHRIDGHMEPPEVVGAAITVSALALNKASKSEGVGIDDPDCLFEGLSKVDAVVAATPNFINCGQFVRRFDPPILYAKSQIYLGVWGNNNVGTMTQVCRIGYTLEKVSKDAFIAALIS